MSPKSLWNTQKFSESHSPPPLITFFNCLLSEIWKCCLIFNWQIDVKIYVNVPICVQKVVQLAMMQDLCLVIVIPWRLKFTSTRRVAVCGPTSFRSLKTFLAARSLICFLAFKWILIVWTPLSVTAEKRSLFWAFTLKGKQISGCQLQRT